MSWHGARSRCLLMGHGVGLVGESKRGSGERVRGSSALGGALLFFP